MMLPQNKRYFDILGISKWHEKGILGQGMKIAVMDSICDVSHPIYNNQVKVVLYDGKIKKNSFSHGGSVCHILTQVCPESEIYLMRCNTESMQWCLDNNIDVVNISLRNGSSDPKFYELSREALEKGMLLFTSAGNTAEKGLGPLAKKEDWIAVGAARLMNPGRSAEYITRASYSSISKENAEIWESVEIVSFSGIDIQSPVNQRGFAFTGTSCASPMMAGKAALLKQVTEITQPELREKFPEFAMDLGPKGFDVEFGHGLFILPGTLPALEGGKEELKLRKGTIQFAVIHHAAKLNQYTAAEVLRIHKARGFATYGYNKLIEPDGKVVIGRDPKWRGAHTLTSGSDPQYWNENALGYCLVWNGEEKPFPDAMYRSLAKELHKDGFQPAQIRLHREVSATLCPGKHFDKVKLLNYLEMEWEGPMGDKKDYEGHYFEADIKKAMKTGLMSGHVDGNFKPDQPVTRAELAAVINRLYLKLK